MKFGTYTSGQIAYCHNSLVATQGAKQVSCLARSFNRLFVITEVLLAKIAQKPTTNRDDAMYSDFHNHRTVLLHNAVHNKYTRIRITNEFR